LADLARKEERRQQGDEGEQEGCLGKRAARGGEKRGRGRGRSVARNR